MPSFPNTFKLGNILHSVTNQSSTVLEPFSYWNSAWKKKLKISKHLDCWNILTKVTITSPRRRKLSSKSPFFPPLIQKYNKQPIRDNKVHHNYDFYRIIMTEKKRWRSSLTLSYPGALLWSPANYFQVAMPGHQLPPRQFRRLLFRIFEYV